MNAIENQPKCRPLLKDVCSPLPELGSRIRVDGDVAQVVQTDARLEQAVPYRVARESRPVLYSFEALFFGSCDDLSIANNTSSGITVVSVESQYQHIICQGGRGQEIPRRTQQVHGSTGEFASKGRPP
jgi:hypothetical protein